MLVYGLVRSIDKPVQGALTWGAAIGVVGLSSSPVLVFALLLSTLAMTIIVRQVRPLPLVIMGLPVAVALIAAWVLPTLHFIPTTANGGCASGGATVSTRSPGRPPKCSATR